MKNLFISKQYVCIPCVNLRLKMPPDGERDVINGDQSVISYWAVHNGVWHRTVIWESGWKSYMSSVQLSLLIPPGRRPDWEATCTLMRFFM